jgi:hypothetical protein
LSQTTTSLGRDCSTNACSTSLWNSDDPSATACLASGCERPPLHPRRSAVPSNAARCRNRQAHFPARTCHAGRRSLVALPSGRRPTVAARSRMLQQGEVARCLSIRIGNARVLSSWNGSTRNEDSRALGSRVATLVSEDIDRVGTNPEGKERAASAGPFGLGAWVGARVVSPRRPPRP